MPRGVHKHFKKPFPKLEELGRTVQIPEVPKTYRNRLWRTIKVRSSLKLNEETSHYMNILCLHFGISRNDLVIHAINLLWTEVLHTVDAERIKLYEDKLEAVRLWRLEKREQTEAERSASLKKAINDFHYHQPGSNLTVNDIGTTWSYNNRMQVRDEKPQDRVVVLQEEEEDIK